MQLAPDTRFAHAQTWSIDVNDNGGKFHEIYHVMSSTSKTVLVLSAPLFHGDIHVGGNALMNKVLQAHLTGDTLLNQSTAPRRYALKTDPYGNQCFYTGTGTARKCVRLNGGLNPVTYICTATPVTGPVTGKKRARLQPVYGPEGVHVEVIA